MTEINSGIDSLGEQVSATLERWKRVVDAKHHTGMPLSAFWIGGSQDRTVPMIEDFTRKLGINPDCVIQLEINQNYQRKSSLADDLVGLEERISTMQGDRILLIAKGFENAVNDVDEFRAARAGHDWDQGILSYSHTGTARDRFYDRVSEMKKHVVVITTIGFSCGDTVYNQAMNSAGNSQFSDGYLELR